jgi:hypothetical protein
MKNSTVASVAIAIGIAVQATSQVLSGQDPTIQASYWLLGGLPFMVFASGILGFYAPSHPLVWACLMIGADFTTGMVMATGDRSLLPIGVLLYLVYSVPCMVAGWLGALFHRRRDRPRVGE